MLCSCTGPQVGMPDRTPLSVEGYRYPYQILHRLKGAASLPWFHDTTGCPVDESKASEVIDSALSKWNLPGTVEFEPASTAEEAVVQILWQKRDTVGSARFGKGKRGWQLGQARSWPPSPFWPDAPPPAHQIRRATRPVTIATHTGMRRNEATRVVLANLWQLRACRTGTALRGGGALAWSPPLLGSRTYKLF